MGDPTVDLRHFTGTNHADNASPSEQGGHTDSLGGSYAQQSGAAPAHYDSGWLA